MSNRCTPRGLAVLGWLLAPAFSGCTDDRAPIVGTWRIVGFEAELQATGTKEPLFGQHPTGYAMFTDKRAMFMLTGEGRASPKTDQDRVALLNSMIAYTGRYRLEGDRWITSVEAAWNPEFVGTEQSRFFEIQGSRLRVLTTWGVQPNWPAKGIQRRIITFERAE